MNLEDIIKAKIAEEDQVNKVTPERNVLEDDYIYSSVNQIKLFNQQSWQKGRGYEIPTWPIFNKCMEGLESGLYLVAAESNSGKALALDTPILQTNGKWTTIGDIKVGAQVWGDDGLPTFVIMKSPVFKDHDCYRLTCDDGSTLIADADHKWKVYRYCAHKPNNREQVRTTAEMAKCFKTIDKGKKKYPRYWYRIPMQAAIVSYSERKDLPIPPYALGVWLGNGRANSPLITVHIEDYEEEKQHLEEVGITVHGYMINKDSLGVNYRVGTHVERHKNTFTEGLRKLNLINNKHIPEQYLHASTKQRWELLKGLMDTNGSVSHGNCEFCQKASSKINDNFGELLSSLGIKWSSSDKVVVMDGKTFYAKRYHFVVSKANTCFKKKRKTALLREELLDRSFLYKTIIDIEKVDTVPTQCIQVSNASHCYLVGDHLTVTHNTAVLQDLLLGFCLNPKNKLFGVYFSLDDTADKILPRVLASKAKVQGSDEPGVPIALFSKPQRYLDQLKALADKSSDEATILYSYLYNDITETGAIDLDFLEKIPDNIEEFPNSVRNKTYRWYQEQVTPYFKIVDGTHIRSGEELIKYCKDLQAFIRAEYGLDWNLIIGIDAVSDITWDSVRFGTDKELNDYTSRTLKEWAVEELRCPIFGNIHLRKIDQKKRPTIADVKESGRWIYEANVVFLLHNEVSRVGDIAAISARDHDNNVIPVIEIQWAKNKQSSFKGRTYALFHTNQSRCVECTEEQTKHYNGLIMGV